jgi:fumarate reductase subunit C
MSRKPFIRPVSKTGWWLKHPRYMRYMSREVTCIFIGAFAFLMVCALERLSSGQVAYESFMSALRSPLGIAGLLIVLAFSLHNATNWFNVTPKALPVQLGEEFLDGKYIIGAHYAVWIVASVAVLVLGGVF